MSSMTLYKLFNFSEQEFCCHLLAIKDLWWLNEMMNLALCLHEEIIAIINKRWFFYNKSVLLLSRFRHVRLCATPQTAAHQAPPSLGFSRQEHWSGLPFPSPMHESEKWRWSQTNNTGLSKYQGSKKCDHSTCLVFENWKYWNLWYQFHDRIVFHLKSFFQLLCLAVKMLFILSLQLNICAYS